MVSDAAATSTRATKRMRLNPCCNGIWSLTSAPVISALLKCLNPCCNGIWSLTRQWCTVWPFAKSVLILVVMEYGLWRRWTLQSSIQKEVLILVVMEYGLWQQLCLLCDDGRAVLILVVMEYGLWPRQIGGWGVWNALCLNPCCNGIWSLTFNMFNWKL